MSAYLNLEASLHDIFWAAEGAPAELPLLADFLALHPGRSLEIGCGSGRLLLPLLARGLDVEGLDNSPDMLALCRKAAATAGRRPAPALHTGDMLAWTPPRAPYPSLLLPAFTFQLASDPAAALRHFARRILAPGGAVYLTVFRPLAELSGDLPENEWFPDHQAALPGGRRATLESRHRIERAGRILVREHRYSLFEPGESAAPAATHTSTHRLRWFEPGELESLLAETGFDVTGRIAEFDTEESVGEDTQILTVHASALRR